MDYVLKHYSSKNVADMMAKISACSKHLKITLFASIPDLNRQEIDTEQIRQVLRASFAVATYP